MENKENLGKIFFWGGEFKESQVYQLNGQKTGGHERSSELGSFSLTLRGNTDHPRPRLADHAR